MSYEILTRASRFALTPRRLDDPPLARALEPLTGMFPGCLTALAGLASILAVLGAIGITLWLGTSWLIPPLVLVACTALVAAGFYFDQRERRASRIATERILRDGPVAVAHVVQANRALYTPSDEILPALVVLTPATEADVALGRHLAANIRALKGAPDPGGDVHPLWAAVNDDHSSPRVAIAHSLTGGRWAYLAAIDVDQEKLPARCLSEHLPEVLVLLDPSTADCVMV